MIRQLGHHGGCSILTSFRLQRPHCPTEVVTVHREERDRAMDPPVLREAIGLPHLPRVPVPVRTVVTLHERYVHRATRARFGQRRLHRRHGAEDHPRRHLHHAALLPGLVHRGIVQTRRRHLVRLPRPPRLAGPRRHHLGTDRLQDRPLTGRILVARDQLLPPPIQPPLAAPHP